MSVLRPLRIPTCPPLRLTPQIHSAARRTFRRAMSDKPPPFFSPQPGPRPGTSSTHRNMAVNTFRSYATYGPTGLAYRSAKAVVWSLIGLNSAVFATWKYAEYTKDAKLLHFLTDNFMLSTESIKARRYHTILTAAFSHYGLVHFTFNMFGLYTFGSLMAMAGVGGFHVLAAGLGSALVASFADLYHQKSRQAPQRRNIWGAFGGERTRTLIRSLGASGLVMGLSATATCLMPLAPMHLMFIPIPIPLFALTAVYFGLDAYYLDRGQTNIGHAAHMGGAVFGAIYYFSYLGKYGGVWPILRRAILRR